MNRYCPICNTRLNLKWTGPKYGTWSCPVCHFEKEICGAMKGVCICADLDHHRRTIHECDCGETWEKSTFELKPRARPKEEW